MLDSLFRGEKYTTEELNARLKFFIGIILGLTLFGIVFVVLYSLIFVTQPMNGMSPVDNKFFELIIPIATFLTGTLSGIMLAGDDKELRGKAIDAAAGNSGGPRPSTPAPSSPTPSGFSASASVGGLNMSFNKPSTPAPAAPAPAFGAAPAPTFGSAGKAAPAQPEQPEI